MEALLAHAPGRPRQGHRLHCGNRAGARDGGMPAFAWPLLATPNIILRETCWPVWPGLRMPEERFLLVRLGSLGDVIFTLPTLAALRDTFPDAQIDWVIDRRWAPLLARNPDLSHMISLPDRSVGAFLNCARSLRASKYTCAIDIQGLYKSALLARLSGAPRRIGFTSAFVREGGAAMFYTERVAPREPHMVGQNLELAMAAGARAGSPRFPLHVSEAARAKIDNLLKENAWQQYAVLSPGGGWRSKCWPPERFGAVARILWETPRLASVHQ